LRVAFSIPSVLGFIINIYIKVHTYFKRTKSARTITPLHEFATNIARGPFILTIRSIRKKPM
jgi:hypothetical protein